MIKKLLKKIKRAYLVHQYEALLSDNNFDPMPPKFKALSRLRNKKFWDRLSRACRESFERLANDINQPLFDEPLLGEKVNAKIMNRHKVDWSDKVVNDSEAPALSFVKMSEQKAIRNFKMPCAQYHAMEAQQEENPWHDSKVTLEPNHEADRVRYLYGGLSRGKSFAFSRFNKEISVVSAVDFEENEG